MKRWLPKPSGFVSLPMVSFVSLILFSGILMVMREGAQRRQSAAMSQLRIDRHQREEGMMRALLALLPAKISKAMQQNYASDPELSWSGIFAEAAAKALVAHSLLTTNTLGQIGISGAGSRSGNSADIAAATAADAASWITDLEGNAGRVTPGLPAFEGILEAAGLLTQLPPVLATDTSGLPANVAELDAIMPILGSAKLSQNDPLLGLNQRTYSVQRYPSIRLNYTTPGSPFVAKHNWWVFRIRPPGTPASAARHYLISLYEVPAQQPIESLGAASIGMFTNGESWNSDRVRIEGSITAKNLEVSSLNGASSLLGRQGVNLLTSQTFGSTTVGANFDDTSVRYALQAAARNASLPVAVAANQAQAAFHPVGSAATFMRRSSGEPTLWDRYSCGAQRCRTVVRILEMDDYDIQLPNRVEVLFYSETGDQVSKIELATAESVTSTLAGNWQGGSTPFEREVLPGNPAVEASITRHALRVHLNRLRSWASTLALPGVTTSAVDSLCFELDAPTLANKIRPEGDPARMCLLLRDGSDLSEFTQGLSIIAPLRVHVGGDINTTARTGETTSYPPLSLFVSELRYGTIQGEQKPVVHEGQINAMTTTADGTWHPLDLRSGDDSVHTDRMEVTLKPIRDPTDLAPIHPMNWLLVIEQLTPP
jgi:hypothetical protein